MWSRARPARSLPPRMTRTRTGSNLFWYVEG
jgi:hypothetical protein